MLSLVEFLSWVTGVEGGALLLVAWVISWGLEDWAKWQALKSKARSGIIVGIAVVLGLLARWIQFYPDLVAVIDPYFRVISNICLVWLSTQTAHRLNNLRKPGDVG